MIRDVAARAPAAWFETARCPLVTVAGESVRAVAESELPWERAAALAYPTVVGPAREGAEPALGDGVVPLAAAHLQGAAACVTLDCLHSVNVAGTKRPSAQWYGAEKQIDGWLVPLVDVLVEAEKD